jgi:hypothetical protein
MSQPTQSYKNHTRLYPLFHFVVFPVLVFNFINAIRHLWNRPMRDMVWEVIVAFALVAFAWTVRVMVVSVQDRVIRLEMQLRLRSLLPADVLARANALTPKQLVALRFAGDDEMPSLVSDVLAGKVSTSKEIKQRIQNWQADHLRA